MSQLNNWRFAARAASIRPSAIREMLKITQQPQMISFAGGLPSPALFPLDRIREASERVLRDQPQAALQYSTTEGYAPLRQWIAERVSQGRVNISPDQVLIVSGSQQALDLTGKLFLDPEDTVLVEAPTYVGALQTWNTYQARYDSVPIDADGIQLEAFEAALQRKPKMAYILPNFQNPSGVRLSLERRAQVAELAQRYGVPIFEDDAYARLGFEGEDLPNLYGYAPENTLYFGTFSKTLVPGYRLAWIVGPPEIIQRLVHAKQAADLHTSTIAQMTAYEAIKDGFLEEHAQSVRKVYAERCQYMLAQMREHFPAEVRWNDPQGGMFIWVTLPAGLNSQELLQQAVAQKVAFVPGVPFFADGSGSNTFRLSYATSSPEQIATGIERLGQVLKAAMQAQHASTLAP